MPLTGCTLQVRAGGGGASPPLNRWEHNSDRNTLRGCPPTPQPPPHTLHPPPPKECRAIARGHKAPSAQKRRKKTGSSVAYKTIGAVLSQEGHGDASGQATNTQRNGARRNVKDRRPAGTIGPISSTGSQMIGNCDPPPPPPTHRPQNVAHPTAPLPLWASRSGGEVTPDPPPWGGEVQK